MSRKRRKKHHRIGFVSNIRINTKVLIIFISQILAIGVMFAGMMTIVYKQLDDNKNELEESVLTSSEQYVSTAVENMISIAKTVYTNESIYSFLSTRYLSQEEYQLAYYELFSGKSFVAAEVSSVDSFKIYTANSTVSDDGDIVKLESVVNEDWYVFLTELKKDMIVFCDKEHRNLSLIRKLNYKNIHTGDAYLKLDFNSEDLQNIFENLSFDGQVYVMSDDITLYSNHDIYEQPTEDFLSNSLRLDKNYYTCNISYYVRQNKKDVFSVILKPSAIPATLLFIICQAVVVIIILDFKNRTREVYEACAGKKILNKVYYGEDEIGKLFNGLKNTLVDVKRLNEEKHNLTAFVNEYKKNTNDILISALNYNTSVNLGINQSYVENFVSLQQEILNINRFLDNLSEKTNFRYTLVSDTEANEKTIIPYSLSVVALYLATYGTNDSEMEIDIREFEECYRVRFFRAGVKMSSAELLRLRAVFEPDGERSLLTFDSSDEFNPFIRLSRFYGDDISLTINSKDVVDIELVLRNKANE